MSGLRFIPLGVGDAFTARYYSFSLAIEADGQYLLIDCPHPIRKMMREASQTSGIELDVDKVAAVAVTHLHADHCSGLEGLGYFSYFLLGRKMPLLAHPEVAEALWPHHLEAGMGQLISDVAGPALEMHLEDYFEPWALSLEAATQFGPFTIEARKTFHHIPTTALRIRAGGRTLGISADTCFDPALIDWLGEADLVVHETNYGIHTPYEKLLELPAATRSKMRLIHYPDDFDTAGSEIEPLIQGGRYEV